MFVLGWWEAEWRAADSPRYASDGSACLWFLPAEVTAAGSTAVGEFDGFSLPVSCVIIVIFIVSYLLVLFTGCRILVHIAQPLLPAVSALLQSQYRTHSLVASALVLHHILSVIFLKPTVWTRPSVPPCGSHKRLKFGLWPTPCTLKDSIYLLTYLLTCLLTYQISLLNIDFLTTHLMIMMPQLLLLLFNLCSRCFQFSEAVCRDVWLAKMTSVWFCKKMQFLVRF